MYKACLEKDINKIKTMLTLPEHRHNINFGLYASLEIGDNYLVDFLIKRGAIIDKQCLEYVCKCENEYLLNLVLNSCIFSNKDLNLGLISSCKKGNLQFIKKIISLGADDYDMGLNKACIYQHNHIIDYLLTKGIKNWNIPFYGACESGDLKLVNLMIKNGAKDWEQGASIARIKNFKNLLLLMLEKGASFRNCILDDNDIIYLYNKKIKIPGKYNFIIDNYLTWKNDIKTKLKSVIYCEDIINIIGLYI